MMWTPVENAVVKTTYPKDFEFKINVLAKAKNKEVSAVSVNKDSGESVVLRFFAPPSEEFDTLKSVVARMERTGPVFVPGISRTRPVQCDLNVSECRVSLGSYIVIEDAGGALVDYARRLQGQVILDFGGVPAHLYFTLRGEWSARASELYAMLNSTTIVDPNIW